MIAEVVMKVEDTAVEVTGQGVALIFLIAFLIWIYKTL